MTHSMYQASAPVFIQGLNGLLTVLDKAAAHVEARKLDPAALLQARLYPDMFNFTRQVQIATDFAKGSVARLAGLEPPPFADVETSFAELRTRVEAAIAFLKSIEPAQVDGSEDRDITLVRRGEASVVKGQPYLLQQAIPNFYFHLSMAYGLLRHNGVELGKRDFLGAA